MSEGEVDLGSKSDLLLESNKPCKHYWYSDKEAKMFAEENESQTHSNDRRKMGYMGESLFTACTESNVPPARFDDYKAVPVSEGAEFSLGESWDIANFTKSN